jgi:uncharacterized membrane protein
VGTTGIGNAWLTSGGAITYIPRLGYAIAVNNAGADGGSCRGQEQFNFSVATLWSGPAVTQLGVLPRTTGSAALGVNDSGQVVGYSYRNGTNGCWRGLDRLGWADLLLGLADVVHTR